jgi:hypothetical protein
MSVRQRYRAVLWGVLTIVLAVTGTEAQPTVTVTMRLAEAEWHVVRQEVLPRFEMAPARGNSSGALHCPCYGQR